MATVLSGNHDYCKEAKEQHGYKNILDVNRGGASGDSIVLR
jgi:hypothetical protein